MADADARWDDGPSNKRMKREVEEDAAGESSGGPKLSQREKNREAVRNCRKRKKEHAKQLKDRIDELNEENAKLRLELQLGHGGGARGNLPQPIGLEEERELIEEMVVLVRKAQEEEAAAGTDRTSANKRMMQINGPPRSDTEIALRRKIQVYMERHQDHGRDRQKAIGFILGRLQRLVVPETITKQYLHMMSTSSSMSALHENEEWRGLIQELQLNDQQLFEFSGRRRYAKRLRTELDCAFEKMKSIVDRCRRNKRVGDSLNELTTILKPEQFARFVVWVQSNPACKDILDELWGKLMGKCDVHINREIYGNPARVQQIKRFQENSAALSIRLFSIANSRARESIAKLCVHPDVVLVDANNNVDKRGIRAVTRYMSYVSTAFDTQSCPKTKAQRALNVEEKSIVSDQQDDKVTGSWRLSGVYIGRLRPRKSPGSSTTPGGSSTSPASGGSNTPRTPFGAGLDASLNDPGGGAFKLPSSLTGSSSGGSDTKNGLPSRASRATARGEAPEPLLTPEEQKERTVTFNVIVEFSFGDLVRPELITEMIISWDAMSLVNQLGLLNGSVRGVLPPPNVGAPPQGLPPPTSAIQPNDQIQQKEHAEEESRTQEKGGATQASTAAASPTASPHALVPTPAADAATESTPAAVDAESVGASVVSEVLSEASKLARERALKLSKLFMIAEPDAREQAAQQILDPKCVFDDIHMGAKYRGVGNCLNYIRRLRRAFPTFDIMAQLVSSATPTSNKRTSGRSRATSNGSTPSEASSAAATAGVPTGQLREFELAWVVSGTYGGRLVQQPKKCQIKGKVFVSTNPLTQLIVAAKIDLPAQDLMHQLGILLD